MPTCEIYRAIAPTHETAVETPAYSPGDVFADVSLPAVPDIDTSAGRLPVPDNIGGIGTAKMVDIAFSLGVLALGIAAVKKMFKWIYNSR